MAHVRRRAVTACVFLPLLVIALCLASSAVAQTPRPMGIVDWLNIPQISDPQLSLDGRFVLFTRSVTDWQTSRMITHIWRAEPGGEPIQLTHGAEGESSPLWAPDGKTIAFIARRGGETAIPQIYLLPSDGGEGRQLTTHATAVSAISWTPDGKALLFRAAEVRTAVETAKERARDDVYAYDENYKHFHLWKITVEGRAETRVTNGPLVKIISLAVKYSAALKPARMTVGVSGSGSTNAR